MPRSNQSFYIVIRDLFLKNNSFKPLYTTEISGENIKVLLVKHLRRFLLVYLTLQRIKISDSEEDGLFNIYPSYHLYQ